MCQSTRQLPELVELANENHSYFCYGGHVASDYPQSYDQWRRCITVDCGIDLTDGFIEARLQALGDPTDVGTAKFVELYGDAYLKQVVVWFEPARSEVGAA